MSPFRIPILLWCGVMPAAAAHTEVGSSVTHASRYAVTATLQPTPASADGRYRVNADLRVAAAVQSADGRYRVKAVAATCDPADDRVFANGFEAP